MDPSGRLVYGVYLRPLSFWDYEFESRRECGYLTVVNAVCCQVEASGRADHLSRGVLPSVTRVTESVHEAPVMSMTCPNRGCRAMKKIMRLIIRLSPTALLIEISYTFLISRMHTTNPHLSLM